MAATLNMFRKTVHFHIPLIVKMMSCIILRANLTGVQMNQEIYIK